MAYIYLLHFAHRICRTHPCQHYIGSAEDIILRIQQHSQGRGYTRLTEVAYERGIEFEVVRLWKGGRLLEQRLKSLKNAPKFCPLCNSRKPWTLFHPDTNRPVREIKHIKRKLGANYATQ